MYDGTEETFDSLLFYLLRVTLGRQGDVFDILYTFLAFSFPLFWRKTLPSCYTGMDKKFCNCKASGRKQKKKKRKTNIPKREKRFQKEKNNSKKRRIIPKREEYLHHRTSSNEYPIVGHCYYNTVSETSIIFKQPDLFWRHLYSRELW